MTDDLNELLRKLKMYADLLLCCGASAHEVLKTTVSSVGFELLDLSGQIENVIKDVNE